MFIFKTAKVWRDLAHEAPSNGGAAQAAGFPRKNSDGNTTGKEKGGTVSGTALKSTRPD